MPSDQGNTGRAKGTVYIEVQVQKRLALSRALDGWSEEEIGELLAGDKEARRELEDEMVAFALQDPDDVEPFFLDIRVGAEVLR